jgi:transketolase
MIEDLAPLSALERLPVFVPCTEAEVKNSVNSALKLEGPSYIRLARQERVPALREKKLGQFAFVKAGVTHLFLTYGSMSSQSFFAERADEAAVVSTDCLYPINVDLLCRISNAFSRVTVVEDHVWAGGLGSRLSKLVACGQLELEFDWMGVESPFDNLQGGKANYLQRKHGLDSFRSSKEWTNGNC